MQHINDLAALRIALNTWRDMGQTIALVPTMGNLHAGHYSLLTLARARADRVVVSVFVNPTQFGPGEDFEHYPRTLEKDREGLIHAGCDMLFTPDVSTMYPLGAGSGVNVHVPQITQVLEGGHRSGHFDGVATVVSKLFNMVQPDLAVFGQKDFQQCKVIERLALDLLSPVRVVMAPTQRAPDGLALSSRNQYLSTEQRALAPQIYATLLEIRQWMIAGQPWHLVEQRALSRLEDRGFVVDYVAIRRAHDLSEPGDATREELVALITARLGSVRLLDNLVLM